MSSLSTALVAEYPWTEAPLVVCAPLRRLARAPLAVAVSSGGGFGFIGIGDESAQISSHLQEASSLLFSSHQTLPTRKSTSSRQILPIGIGLICHSASLTELITALKDQTNPLPAAVWLFAPAEEKARPDSPATLGEWTKAIHEATNDVVHVWHQVGSVKDARDSMSSSYPPDVLVVQGMDAGGHGLTKGASLMALLPEICSELRSGSHPPNIVGAGGIADGRGAAAALALGAAGVVMGTRFLSAREANVAQGYQEEVMRAGDGGQTTIRTRLYDSLRSTTGWPERYGGRGVINESFSDAQKGMNEEENKKLYDDALNEKAGVTQWGPKGRLTTYAGTAVGLVKDIKSAADITVGVRAECFDILRKLSEMSIQ